MSFEIIVFILLIHFLQNKKKTKIECDHLRNEFTPNKYQRGKAIYTNVLFDERHHANMHDKRHKQTHSEYNIYLLCDE